VRGTPAQADYDARVKTPAPLPACSGAFVEFARSQSERPDWQKGQTGCYHLTSGNSFIERLQAARHSTLLMCVAASQKPMQSASALPPPPGLLGADEVPGERARLGEEPPSVANWLGKGSDIGDSGDTDPGCAVVGVVVACAPPGGVSPAEGVGDKGVGPAEGDGTVGVVAPGDTLGVVLRKVVVGAESLGLGAARDAGEPPADERACANAASGYSSKRATAARTGGLGVSIENHHGVVGSTPSLVTIGPPAPSPVTIGHPFCDVHNLASGSTCLAAAARACW
jgi:hypothetical protein